MDIIKKYKSEFIYKKINKNIIVFNEGNKCDKVGYLLSGAIKIFTSTSNKEEIINIIKPNEFFGDNLIFSNYNEYLGSGITLINSEILYISKNKLIELMKNNDFCEFFLSNICNKEISLRLKNRTLVKKTIKDKILFYLQEQSKIYKTNCIFIKNVSNLSKILNIPRPSLSRELTKLVNKGFIDKEKNKIILK